MLEQHLNCVESKFYSETTNNFLQKTKGEFTPFSVSSSLSQPSLGLVIDGRTLAYALDKGLEDKFLSLARKCRSVLCCRSTPIQKGMVVKLIRDKLKTMTLAIGKYHDLMSIGLHNHQCKHSLLFRYEP